MATEDLRRLLLNTGLPPGDVEALLYFESVAYGRVAGKLSTNNTTDAAFLPLRKPPVGALLSAGHVILQLRSAQPELFTRPNEAPYASDAAVCESEGAAWITRWSQTGSERAFAKALIDVYVKRQTDQRVAQVRLFSLMTSRSCRPKRR